MRWHKKSCNLNVIFKKPNKYKMDGKFLIKMGSEVLHFDHYDDIPKEIGAVISFKPNFPTPPHTEEEHKLIETLNGKLKQLMERECQRLRG